MKVVGVAVMMVMVVSTVAGHDWGWGSCPSIKTFPSLDIDKVRLAWRTCLAVQFSSKDVKIYKIELMSYDSAPYWELHRLLDLYMCEKKFDILIGPEIQPTLLPVDVYMVSCWKIKYAFYSELHHRVFHSDWLVQCSFLHPHTHTNASLLSLSPDNSSLGYGMSSSRQTRLPPASPWTTPVHHPLSSAPPNPASSWCSTPSALSTPTPTLPSWTCQTLITQLLWGWSGPLVRIGRDEGEIVLRGCESKVAFSSLIIHQNA